jgi:HK97 gp10 family phage protein
MKVINLDGYKEAMELIKQLDKITAEKVVLSILRKSASPLVAKARSNIKGYSKTIAKDIKARKIKRAKNIGISVKPGAKAWYAHFVEYGTSGIVQKPGGYFRKDAYDVKFAMWVGKVKQGQRYRKDTEARPFMRPAIDSTKTIVEARLSKLLKEDLDKTIDKYKK